MLRGLAGSKTWAGGCDIIAGALGPGGAYSGAQAPYHETKMPQDAPQMIIFAYFPKISAPDILETRTLRAKLFQ